MCMLVLGFCNDFVDADGIYVNMFVFWFEEYMAFHLFDTLLGMPWDSFHLRFEWYMINIIYNLCIRTIFLHISSWNSVFIKIDCCEFLLVLLLYPFCAKIDSFSLKQSKIFHFYHVHLIRFFSKPLFLRRSNIHLKFFVLIGPSYHKSYNIYNLLQWN